MCYKNKMSDFLTKIKKKIYRINLTFLYHNSFEKQNYNPFKFENI